MSTRKYLSEFGLNSIAGYRLLLQQSELNNLDDLEFEPHIYIIGRRPRITIDPTSVKFANGKIKGLFKIQRENSFEDIPFETNNLLGTENLKVISDYPYTECKFVTEDGNELLTGKAALLLAKTGYEFWKYLDLEVLYIGQSYGEDGNRTAVDRLKNHSTLQNIYSEALRLSPDHDIWLILCSFDLTLIGSFDGRPDTSQATPEEDSAHIKEVTKDPISLQQQINFTEAALIRHFQPEYNVRYKDTFPSPAHSTYSTCYDVDLNMISIEISTKELGLRLWSVAIKPEWVHLFNYPLHSAQERKHMFDIF